MKKNELFFILVFVVLFSCTNKQGKEEKVLNFDSMLSCFNNEISIDPEIVIDDSIQLKNPFQINLFQEYILIENLEKDNDGLLDVFDLSKNEFVGKFLKKGNGPDEFIGFRVFPFGEDSILVLNVFNNTGQVFSKTKIGDCNSVPDRRINFKLTKGSRIDQCLLLNNKIIASGQFKEGLFNIFDKEGNFIKAVGSYPVVDYSAQIDNFQLGYIFGSTFSFVQNHDKLRFAYKNISGMGIFDKNFKKIHSLSWNTPVVREATYNKGKPYVVQEGNGLFLGAGDIVANKQYVFFSFSKYDFAETMKLGIENEYEYLFVTDWEGKPIKRIKLNKPIKFPLEIDQDGKFIYAIHVDTQTGFPLIIKYDISNVI